MPVNPENAAFLPEMVVVPGLGGQHATAFMRASAARRPVAASLRWCRRPVPSRPTAFYTDCGTTARAGCRTRRARPRACRWLCLMRALVLLEQPVEIVLVLR